MGNRFAAKGLSALSIRLWRPDPCDVPELSKQEAVGAHSYRRYSLSSRVPFPRASAPAIKALTITA
jgi:hypothetical protein